MSLQETQSVYCIGIGGIGLSALAQLLHADGVRVSGSDRSESQITAMLQRLGVQVVFEQDGSGLPEDANMVIYSGAVPEQHPERKLAAERGISQMSYFEALGVYSSQFEKVVAVSGTHGKSTTTAMIANILVEAGLNPTVIVGSVVREFGEGDGTTQHGSNARPGGKQLLVVEACEYQSQFLHLQPHVLVVNNIEADHLDYYDGVEQIVESFQKLVDNMPVEGRDSSSGTLVLNADDSNTMQLQPAGRRAFTFGWDEHAQIHPREHSVKGEAQEFIVDGTVFVLTVPGAFNVSNALAAIAVARELEVDDAITQQALEAFNGIWRRFEIISVYKKALIVSDYAHHPTAIQATVAAARDFYPSRRIVVAFQPHQRARTAQLFNEFVEALAEPDVLVLQEIYDVAGREEQDQQMNSGKLVEALEERGLFPTYTPDNAATVEVLDDIIEKDDVVIIMGAGDIYTITQEFE